MDKEAIKKDINGLSYGRGYVYSLQYHIVWCTKYRRKVLKNGIDEACKELLQQYAEEYHFSITAMEVMQDHIHLQIDATPQFCIPDMLRIMKGGIARKVFLEYPEIKAELWKGHLWNPSYCVVTVSDRSAEQVRHYIETQKEQAWQGIGRPPKDLEELQAYHRRRPDADNIEL